MTAVPGAAQPDPVAPRFTESPWRSPHSPPATLRVWCGATRQTGRQRVGWEKTIADSRSGAMPSPSADRNLLFGVLAVQMDFVSRERLFAAMNAWVVQKHRPLAEV